VNHGEWKKDQKERLHHKSPFLAQQPDIKEGRQDARNQQSDRKKIEPVEKEIEAAHRKRFVEAVGSHGDQNPVLIVTSGQLVGRSGLIPDRSPVTMPHP
jgi:hypothetical protein